MLDYELISFFIVVFLLGFSARYERCAKIERIYHQCPSHLVRKLRKKSSALEVFADYYCINTVITMYRVFVLCKIKKERRGKYDALSGDETRFILKGFIEFA